MPSKPLAYVSGSYRDSRGSWYVEGNIHSAGEAAVKLWRLGFSVICPHYNTMHMDGAVPVDDLLAGDLVQVERSDCVVMLYGWEKSEGATLEHTHAVIHGVPVFDLTIGRGGWKGLQEFLYDYQQAEEAVRNGCRFCQVAL